MKREPTGRIKKLVSIGQPEAVNKRLNIPQVHGHWGHQMTPEKRRPIGDPEKGKKMMHTFSVAGIRRYQLVSV